MLARMPRSSSRKAVPGLRLKKGLEERIDLALFDLTSHLQRGGERLASQVGITSLQWIVLLQIAGDPNFAEARDAERMMLATEIANQRALSKPTISAVVSELRRRGLIREQKDPSDRRLRRLVVTQQGARALASLEPIRRAANRRLLQGLDKADRRQLLHYLEQCMAVLWKSRAPQDETLR